MPVKMVTAMALANAARMNLCLVVLMVPFIVDYRLNDTVDVFTQPAAQAPLCRVWDLVIYRILRQFPLESVGGAEISYTLSASTGTPSHFAAAARSVNSETCSGEWSVNMACNFG